MRKFARKTGRVLAAIAGNGAWGRPLAMGNGALVPFLNDLNPVLNAGPF